MWMPYPGKRAECMNEKKLFRILTVLGLASAALLGVFFLSGFLSGRDRLDAEMKAYFGENTEFAKDEEDKYIYCAYSLRERPEAVWFQVDKKDPLENNFIEQMMKRDALTFWRTKDREVYFVDHNKEVYTLEEAQTYRLEEPVYLSLSCSSWEDLSACADEMKEWAEYVGKDPRYFWNYHQADVKTSFNDVFTQFEVRIKGKAFWVNFSGAWILNRAGSGFKEELIDLMETEFDRLFPGEPKPEKPKEEPVTEYEIRQRALEEEEARQEALTEEEAWQESLEKWVQTYDGEFEPEAAAEFVLEDSNVCYRLINTDYIMGNYFYVLIKSTDGKKTWELVNADPFDGSMYGAAEITFQDENHGTIAGIYTDHSSNQYRKKIYVTEDGGKTFVESKRPQPR